jgi:uncharacterized membrane protein YdbT with pleckstrin-like domain
VSLAPPGRFPVANRPRVCYENPMSEETTFFRGSPSVLTRFGPLFLACLVLAGAIAGVVLLRDGEPAVPWALGGLAVLALVYLLAVIWVVKTTQYEVTSERIRIRRGILTKRTDELELYRANDTSLIEPLLLRLFGLGTIEVRTMEAGVAGVSLEAVHGARGLRERLRSCIEECRDRKRVQVTEFEDNQPKAT